MKKRLWGLLALVMLISPVYGQLSELDLFTQKDVVVITATKTEQKLSEAPSIMSVYLGQELEQMPYDELAEFLNSVPGLVVSMGPDGKYRLTLRAQRAPGEVLLLVDGQKINDIYTGEGDYEIPLDWVERIEILRGPASALFGTNALTGIVNIITKKPDPEDNGIKAVGIAKFSKDGLKKGVDLSGTYSLNEFFRMDAELKFTDPYGMEITKDIYSDRDPNSLLFGGKKGYTYRKFKGGDLRLTLDKGKFKGQVIGLYRNHDAYAGYSLWYAPGSELKDNLLLGGFSYKYLDREDFNSELKFTGLYKIHDYLIKERPDGYVNPTSGDTFPEGMLTKEYYKEYTIGVEDQFNYNASENLNFTFGIQAEISGMPDFYVYRNYSASTHQYFAELGNHDSLDFSAIKDRKRTVVAAYLQMIYKSSLGSMPFQVVLGGRYDRYSDVKEKMPFVPRIAFMIEPVKNFRVRFMYGGAFRAPTFKELYDRSSIGKDAIYGNEDLSPEKITTPEVGIEYTFSRGFVKFNAYENKLENIIRPFDPQGSGKYGWYENIGDIESYGAEFSFRFALMENLGILGNYSYVLPVFYWNKEKLGENFLASIGAVDGTWLRNLPHYRANLGLSFKFGKEEGFYKVKGMVMIGYFGARENNTRLNIEAQHEVNIPSAVTLDFSIFYRFSPEFMVFLKGYNLTASYYADPVGTSDIDAFGDKGLIQPGRKLSVGIKYNY